MTCVVVMGDTSSAARPSGPEAPTVGTGPATADALVLSVGDRIDRYIVLDTLGAGGMGVVYLAYDPTLDRKVALKLLLSGQRAELKGRQRMLREAQALAKLAHPNVVVVHEVGTTADALYIAMEHVPGDTLAVWLSARPDWRRVVQAFIAAGRGLAAAHVSGVVHRDFKPSNVLMGEDATRPRVVDFGLARPGAPSMSSTGGSLSGSTSAIEPLTQAGVVMGTPRYMAPEQHLGKPGEASCDQYAFCIALFEALHDRPAFAHAEMEALHAAKRQGAPATPKGSRLPTRLNRVVTRGLQPLPADRFPSMDALLLELQRVVAPRRRTNALAAGLVVVAAASGWLALAPSDDPCGAGVARIEAVWGNDAHTEIADAFAAASPMLAESTWGRVEPALDDYATAWAATHRDACEDSELRHEQSPALMDQRMQCLADRLRTLRASVRALAAADAETVRGALGVVEGLPSVARCDDVEYVSAQVQPPDDPAVAREVERLRDDVADAEAIGATGHYEPALQALSALTERVDRTEYGPLRVEHALAHARHVAMVGRYADAESLLHDVEVDARRLSLFRAATTAEVARVGVMHKLDRPREALQLARLAEADAERDGDVDVHAHVLDLRGTILSVQGQHAEALAELRRALDLVEQSAPESLVLVNAHAALGAAHRRAGDSQQARREQELALELARARMGERHPDVAAGLSSLSIYRHDTGDLDGALRDLDAALSIARESLGERHPTTAELLGNKASMLGAAGQHEAALVLLDEVLQVRVEQLGPRSRMVARTYNNIAVEHYSLGRVDEAIAMSRRSVEIREELLGDKHPETINAIGNLGGLLAEADKLDEAAPLLERALAANIELVGEDHPDVLTARSNLARLRLEQGRTADASEIAESLMRSAERSLPPVHVDWPRVWRTHAMVASADGRVQDAIADHERELAAATATNQPREIERAQQSLDETRALARR